MSAVHKGQATPSQAVSTVESGASCGFSFHKDGRYIVMALREGDRLTTSLCSGTTPFDGITPPLHPPPSEALSRGQRRVVADTCRSRRATWSAFMRTGLPAQKLLLGASLDPAAAALRDLARGPSSPVDWLAVLVDRERAALRRALARRVLAGGPETITQADGRAGSLDLSPTRAPA